MPKVLVALIISLSVAIVLFIPFLILLIIPRRNRAIVLKNSERLKKLVELNEQTEYRKYLNSDFYEIHTCKSKGQYDRFNLQNFAIECINLNRFHYEKLIREVEISKELFSKYDSIAKNIISTISEEECKRLKITKKVFLKYEEKLFREHYNAPLQDINVHFMSRYTSPKGRNSYKRDDIYDCASLLSLMQRAQKIDVAKTEKQKSISAERSKMSDSLRYDILKRDKFRCQICGATAADGVKLHVDHIMPVSKGGRTEKSNLRTLCDRCNLGKRDKIEKIN